VSTKIKNSGRIEFLNINYFERLAANFDFCNSFIIYLSGFGTAYQFERVENV
jgi:hypothetical protein